MYFELKDKLESKQTKFKKWIKELLNCNQNLLETNKNIVELAQRKDGKILCTELREAKVRQSSEILTTIY